jgi:hypothetical protein
MLMAKYERLVVVFVYRLCTRTVTRSGIAAVTSIASTGRMRNSINPVYLKLLNYAERRVVVYQIT